MKRKFITITMVLVAALLLMAGCSPVMPGPGPAGFQRMDFFGQQNTGIWVTGEGKVTVSPDIANLTLGVEAQSATVSEAQSRAAKAMDAVVSTVKGLGVADNDIKTLRFSIAPIYNYDKGTQTLTGYMVTNIVTVKLRKVADTGAVIDAVTRAGGDLTRINNISFTVNDPAPFFKQARDKAMANAGTKASQLASLGGVTLGKPIYINESGGYVPVPTQYERAPVAGAPAPTTSISPGETEITLNVQVVYSMQ